MRTESIAWLRLVPAMGLRLALALPGIAHAQDQSGRDSLHVAAAASSNVLPFANNPVPINYPIISVAIGYGGFFPSSRWIDEAFRAIGDSLETGGFDVPTAAHFDPGAQMLLTVGVHFNGSIDASCQVARNRHDEDQVRFIGGLLSGRYTLPQARNVSMFGGLGGGRYGFHFKQKYHGARISPIDPSGSYTALDFIILDGGGGYWTTAGGLTVRARSHISIEGLVQYFGMSDVSLGAGSASGVKANLSGTMIVMSFKLFF